jgi:hypothetical protein
MSPYTSWELTTTLSSARPATEQVVVFDLKPIAGYPALSERACGWLRFLYSGRVRKSPRAPGEVAGCRRDGGSRAPAVGAEGRRAPGDPLRRQDARYPNGDDRDPGAEPLGGDPGLGLAQLGSSVRIRGADRRSRPIAR